MTIDSLKTPERIKILTKPHRAPGFEDGVRSYMRGEMEPYVGKFIQNRMGGFCGIKESNKENASRVMVAAHMDEIGFMVTHTNDNGVIQLTNLDDVANDIW